MRRCECSIFSLHAYSRYKKKHYIIDTLYYFYRSQMFVQEKFNGKEFFFFLHKKVKNPFSAYFKH